MILAGNTKSNSISLKIPVSSSRKYYRRPIGGGGAGNRNQKVYAAANYVTKSD